jgi:hypothetical protein
VQNSTPASIFTVDTSTPQIIVGVSGQNVPINFGANGCADAVNVFEFAVSVPSTASHTTNTALPSGKTVANVRGLHAVANVTISAVVNLVLPMDTTFATAIYSVSINATNGIAITTSAAWTTAATVYVWLHTT